MPAATVHQLVWRALTKHLLLKMEINVSNWEGVMNGFSAGDTFNVLYRTSSDGAATVLTYTVVSGPALTPELIANFFFVTFATGASSASEEIILQEFNYQPSPASGLSLNQPVFTNIKDATIHLYSKSTLKCQNTSVGTGGGDEDAVDNNPLHGKAYFGSGSGTEAMTFDDKSTGAAGVPFRADNTYGGMAVVPGNKWYQEPIGTSQFTGVKKYGKVLLEPGHIKTSVLTDFVTFKLNRMYKLIGVSNSATAHSKVLIGTYRFMLMEKIINAVTPSVTNAIKIAYEVNLNIGCYVSLGRFTHTAPLNAIGNFANEL
jgi:hypothetical protein